MNRVKFLSKIALVASVSLALAFTFSCSSGNNDDEGGGGGGNGNSSVTGGADGGGNKNAQIYYGYWDDDDVYRVGDPYTGSGIIEIASSLHCWSGSSGDDGCEWDGLKSGSVTNGIVNLVLPKNIPEEYLEGGEEGSCLALAFKDIKVFGGIFVLTNSNKEYLGELNLRYMDEQILYWYFSKDLNVKITCDNIEYDIDAKAGWNKIYYNSRATPRKLTTKNILTKEVKWMYYNFLDDH